VPVDGAVPYGAGGVVSIVAEGDHAAPEPGICIVAGAVIVPPLVDGSSHHRQAAGEKSAIWTSK
jgi:hypothetical protein